MTVTWKRQFAVLWLGQAVSILTSSISQYALIWDLTARTGSAAVLSLASMAALLPQGVFSLFTGAVADRFDRRKIMALADGAIGLVSLALVAGLLATVLALLFESFTFSDILAAWVPLLYTGIISSGVGYTLQILGQRTVNPTVASLILSLESVFAVLAGWVLLGQPLSPRELVGCALVFAAVVLAQLPDFSGKRGAPDREP